jgi:mono/diheme cytochrome c family protein
MKRTLLTALLVLSCVLAACGGTPQTATEAALSTPTESLPTTLPAPTETLVAVPATETAVPPTEAPAVSVSFANDIMPIFQNSCFECHGVRQVKEGLDMQTHESIMAGSFNGPVVIPGNAGESLLVQLVVQGEMPNRGPKLTAEQIQIIRDWINAGAPNN